MIKKLFPTSLVLFFIFSFQDYRLPELIQIIDKYPSYDNFQYSSVWEIQSYDKPDKFSQSLASIKYFKTPGDSGSFYSYQVELYAQDSNLVEATLLFDGKNYVRLHHDRQMYVLGNNTYNDVNAFQGNIFAIKALLRFIQENDTIKYSIKEDKDSGNIIIETSIDARLLLNVPIKLYKDPMVKTTQVSIKLDKNTYFPINILCKTIFNDGKTQTQQNRFSKPSFIQFEKIVAVDSIPAYYELMDMWKMKPAKYVISTRLPEFNLKSIDNDSYTNDTLAGKIVLFDFFAQYCGPCLMATGDLITLKNEINSEVFEIISIDILKEPQNSKLIEYRNQKGINYPILVKGKKLEDDLGITSIPTFILIDKKGQIIQKEVGYSKDIMLSLKKTIKELIINQ